MPFFQWHFNRILFSWCWCTDDIGEEGGKDFKVLASAWLAFVVMWVGMVLVVFMLPVALVVALLVVALLVVALLVVLFALMVSTVVDIGAIFRGDCKTTSVPDCVAGDIPCKCLDGGVTLMEAALFPPTTRKGGVEPADLLVLIVRGVRGAVERAVSGLRSNLGEPGLCNRASWRLLCCWACLP